GKINSNSNLSTALKEDLLDHFCCVIESEMGKGKDFEEAYQLACHRIAPDGMDELGKEALFLMGKTSKKRLSTLLRFSGFTALTGVVITVIMKSLHLPFGQIALLITAGITLFLFLPSLLTHLINNANKSKWIYIVGFAGFFLLSAAIVFLISHWPNGMVLLSAAILLIYAAVFPLFFYKVHRKKI
ncbi:hypothetical protein LJC68_09500, partial [Bacteroidales bacterium OttesenSCG-928-B11]|nr:hypothetical protein [Bacteroidales bacterium OttesenSCG-928-B11]